MSFYVIKLSLFTPFVCDSFLNFLVRELESYARLWVKTSISFFSYDTETTPAAHQVPSTLTATAVRTAAAVVYSRYRDGTAARKR